MKEFFALLFICIFVLVLISLVYIVICLAINSFFLEYLDIGFTIKFKLPKKYYNKVNPIYNITKSYNDYDKCYIHKHELKLTRIWNFWLLASIPIPMKIFKYRYVETFLVDDIPLFINGVQNTYDDFVKICEDEIIKKDLIDKEIQKKIQLKEQKNLSKEEILKNLNKVFDENYFVY